VNAPQPIEQATIQQYARQLCLTTMAEQFARLAEEAVSRKQSHLGYLEALLEAEIEERERRAVYPCVSRGLRDRYFMAFSVSAS
jgi:DNA replication protein DnaC